MSQARFLELISSISQAISDQPLNGHLAEFLNASFPAGGAAYEELRLLCSQGDRDGWLVAREAAGIKFGRVIKPGANAGHFSVDVVRMSNIRGPHHVHPSGEIGAVFPISGEPKFDGLGAGWYVYPAGSDHHPTISDGDAYVLYLLPDGAIHFTGK